MIDSGDYLTGKLSIGDLHIFGHKLFMNDPTFNKHGDLKGLALK